MITDHDQVVAASGTGSKEYLGKEISRELEDMISGREACFIGARDKGKIPLVADQRDAVGPQAIQPIICAGDVIGSVILLGRGETDNFGETEKKLVQTAAGFLGRQMEQ